MIISYFISFRFKTIRKNYAIELGYLLLENITKTKFTERILHEVIFSI